MFCEQYVILPWLVAISLGTYGTVQNKQLTQTTSHIWSVKKKTIESRMSNLTQHQAMNDRTVWKIQCSDLMLDIELNIALTS